MHRLLTFRRLSAMFLGLFAISIVGLLIYENLVRIPGRRCEEQGRWWDPQSRTCAQPIAIAEITGRPDGVSREEASRRKNRELVAIERQLAENEKAVAADAERQRAALAAQDR